MEEKAEGVIDGESEGGDCDKMIYLFIYIFIT